MLTILRTADADLTRVQQNVKKELDALEAAIPDVVTSPSTSINADYTVKLTDRLVLATPVTDINVWLPEVSTCTGREFYIKNLATAANVNIRGQYVNGAFQPIDNADKFIAPPTGTFNFYSDGVRWWVT